MGLKKKGKANKLARMSEEEKLRYLQHRAAVEEEARRRKEHIISSYMKNKLKHEESFTRLNTAKINQQWRQTLRGLKNKELHDATETLKQVFEIALITKDKIIENLLMDLNDAGKLHSLAVQTHLESIDKIITIHEDRVENASANYLVSRDRRILQAELENSILRTTFNKDVADFEKMLYWEKKCNQNKLRELTKLKVDYRNDTMYQMMCNERSEEKLNKKLLSELECELDTVVKEYKHMFKPFKVHYEHLLESDQSSMQTYRRNKMLIKSYEELIAKLSRRNRSEKERAEQEIRYLERMVVQRKQQHITIKQQIERESRHAEKKLYLLTAVSNQSIKKLEKLANQLETVTSTAKNSTKYLTEKEEVLSSFRGSEKSDGDQNCVNVMKHFWSKYADVHVEVVNLESHYALLLEEHAELKHLLGLYLKTVSRPSSVPSSLIRDRINPGTIITKTLKRSCCH